MNSKLAYVIPFLVSPFAIAVPAQASTFNFDQKITAPDAATGDEFGVSVSTNDGFALVGSRFDDDGGFNSGSAYLFDAATGNFLQKLTAPDGDVEDFFGVSVSVNDGFALIGANGDDDNDNSSGSAYLFDTATGNFLQKLTAPDGAEDDFFGTSVSVDNGFALIGANGDDDAGFNSGSAYLFDTGTGNFLQKFIAPDGDVGDGFGLSVSVDNGFALIGSRFDQDNGNTSGSAYLFDTGTGNFLQKFIAPDGDVGDGFGTSVSVDNGFALIGANGDDDNANNSGAAYLFDTGTGNFLQKLTAPDGGVSDQFGISVSVDNGLALIGSRDNDNGDDSGSAYLFDAATGNFLQKFIAPDAAEDDQFGESVSVDNGVVLVGAFGNDDNGDNSGSAYLFQAATSPHASTPEPFSLVGLLGVVAGFVVRRRQR